MGVIKQKDVYRDILRLFQDKNDKRLKEPFFQDDFVMASDAYTAVKFNRNLLKTIDFEQQINAPTNANKAFGCKNNIKIKLNTSHLRNCINDARKLESETYEVKKHGNCPDCRGDRLVEWHFDSLIGETISRKFECPTCENESEWQDVYNKKTGYEVRGFNSFLKYTPYKGEAVYFLLNRLESVVKTAEMLNIPEIEWCFTEWQNDIYIFNFFKVGECDIIVMASNKPYDRTNDLVTNICS